MQKSTHLTHVDNLIVVEQNRVTQTGPVDAFRTDVRFFSAASRVAGEPPVGARSMLPHLPKKLSTPSPTYSAARLFDQEERAEGGVKFPVFRFYAQCVGCFWDALAIALGVVLSITSKIIASYWFVWWIGDVLQLKKVQYMGGYLGITFSQTIIQG